jgi:colanic acid biosynthesis glycosyl transferase WcaI
VLGKAPVSMARILVITQFFPPETFAGANRVGSMVDALARSHDVAVVTLSPSYPDPSFYDAKDAREADRMRPYRVARPLQFSPHSSSLAVRAIREHVMAIRLALRGAREEADIVITSSPSMFLAPACWVLARTKSCRFAWDIRDIGWEYAGESRQASGRVRPLLKALQLYMWSVAGRADLIVVATPGIADRVRQKTGSRARVLLIGNSVTKEFRDASKMCRERVPKLRPIVAYVGLIGDAQGLEIIADVAQVLPGVDFRIVGEGPERRLLEERVRQMQLTNVQLTGYLAKREVLETYRQCDILFAQLKDTPTLNATALPSKLHEYMATGKPIVYAGKGLAAETVDRIGCGVSVAPGEAAAIAEALHLLLQDAVRMDEMGRKGRAFIEAGADRETAFEELAAVLRGHPGV